jgi:hypothetical protein
MKYLYHEYILLFTDSDLCRSTHVIYGKSQKAWGIEQIQLSTVKITSRGRLPNLDHLIYLCNL